MVEKDRDEYALLKQTIRKMAMERVAVRGTVVTEELYDLVLFNIYNLAKNAGTSVEQIERFYARNLPLTAELAKNLQTFANAQQAS